MYREKLWTFGPANGIMRKKIRAGSLVRPADHAPVPVLPAAVERPAGRRSTLQKERRAPCWRRHAGFPPKKEMPGDYKTIRQSAHDAFIVNKSRFIGYAAPCSTEEEALAFLRQIREKHRDATHNCYAYVIGENAGIMRYSDDGEPGGTAGLPMMEVLKARGVVNCCVVVTRYFGGVLLGAGGLVRAYTKGCAIALNAAQVVRMQLSQRLLVDVPYSLWDRVSYAMKSLPLLVEDTAFGPSVEATVLIRLEDQEAVTRKLAALTDAKAEWLALDTLHYPWPEEETQ